MSLGQTQCCFTEKIESSASGIYGRTTNHCSLGGSRKEEGHERRPLGRRRKLNDDDDRVFERR